MAAIRSLGFGVSWTAMRREKLIIKTYKTMNLKQTLFGALALLTVGCQTTPTPGGVVSDAIWAELPFEMAQVARPEIPNRDLSPVDFGGVGDGITDNKEAFAKCIDFLSEQGGGRVVIPRGVWFTGPIELKSNIELHLDRNAILLFSNNTEDYELVQTTFEGLNTWRCVSPIMAHGLKNIAITGEGIIDGNGDAWRAVKRGKMAPDDWKKLVRSGGILSEDGDTWYPSQSYMFGATTGSDQNVSTWAKTKEDFEKMHDFLRPVMLSIHNCENVLLEGVTFQNSPAWNIHPAMCTNLIVNNIFVRCPWYAQNGDGIDIESCKNVVVTNSVFDVGDDGICIKSGKDEAGRKRGIPCENIIVDNCAVFHGHGGFVVGSEMSGGVKNVWVSNCKFSGTDVGLRFKSTRGRGGVVSNIFIRDIAMNNIATEPLLFDLFYGGKSASEALADGDEAEATDLALKPVDETTPQFRDIFISNVWCNSARRAMLFNGLPEMNVENVTLDNVAVMADMGAQINESTNVVLRNVKVYPLKGEALMMNNVKSVTIENFECPEQMPCAMKVTGSRNRDVVVGSKQISSENSSLSKGASSAVKILE